MNTTYTPDQIRAMSDDELNRKIGELKGYSVRSRGDGYKLCIRDSPLVADFDTEHEAWQWLDYINSMHAFSLLQEMLDGGVAIDMHLAPGGICSMEDGVDWCVIDANSTTQLQRFIAEAWLIWK